MRYVFLLIVISGCNVNTSGILPDSDLTHLEKYHCWPYNVEVYSFDELEIDSLFYSFPSRSYFGTDSKYEETTWSKYNDIDTTVWKGMDKTLKECDDNTTLYKQLLKGRDIYYAGKYSLMKIKSGEKRRRYEEVLFLDPTDKKVHVFKDVNKVY